MEPFFVELTEYMRSKTRLVVILYNLEHREGCRVCINSLIINRYNHIANNLPQIKMNVCIQVLYLSINLGA